LALLTVGKIWHLSSNSMIACGFLGASFIHFAWRPGYARTIAAVCAGGLFALCHWALGATFGPGVLVAALGAGAYLGLGSMSVMVWDVAWNKDSHWARPLTDALILPGFSLVAGIAMGIFNGHAQSTFDKYLYAYDSLLGLAPNGFVLDLFARAPWVGSISYTVYATLLLFPPFYHAWAQHRGDARGGRLMQAFVVAGLCGFVLYQICPAEGPKYLFGALFPGHLPASVELQAYQSAGVHNAMPSMHMTWALLVWWASWELGPIALAIASAFAGFTALATLGSGEHYLIDLIVAVPVVMGVDGIFKNRRWQAMAGLGAALLWLVLLRTRAAFALPQAANWALIAATFLLAAYFRLWPRAGKPAEASLAPLLAP
jgi:hypothetical protein